MRPVRRHHRRSLAISCLVCTGVMMLLYTMSSVVLPIIRKPDSSMQDMVMQLGRRAETDSRLYFLAIDGSASTLNGVSKEEIAESPALQRMKKVFPWNRDVYSLIIERLLGAGALAVVFDITFEEAREGDEQFAEALERYGSKVVVGCNFPESDRITGVATSMVMPTTTLLPAGDPEDPRTGYVTVWPDIDGKVRRVCFQRTLMEASMNLPPLPGETSYESLPVRGIRKAGLANLIPEGSQPRMFRYADDGTTRTLEPKSVYEIFLRSSWENTFHSGEFFKGKIVMVGPEGNSNKDMIPTTFGMIAGALLHLNVMNAILKNDFITEAPLNINLLCIAFGGVMAALLGWFIELVPRMILLVLTGAALFGAAVLIFNAGYVVSVFFPVMALATSGGVFSLAEHLLERQERAKLRKTFERYVSRDVVKELVDNPNTVLDSFVGVRKSIAILFSDVRGFTTLTESADASALVTQLNEYFTEMVRIVFEHHGTLDKFIGDAVMAHWGSIATKGPDIDAQRSVSTALHMSRALVKLNEDWKRRGMTEIHFGIGINFGEAIVGNLGSTEKLEFTAIGDPVNVASRLEGATKQFHVELLIGEEMEPLVRNAFIVRTAGLLRLKGKTRPTEVFTVLTERAAGEALPEWLAFYEEGIRLYRAREFQAAAAVLQKAIVLKPGDWLNEEYLRASQDFLVNPPPADWDGVLIMTTK